MSSEQQRREDREAGQETDRGSLRLVSTGPEETTALGLCFAAVLQPGDVIALDGDLGAGKTCFVTGLASAFGLGNEVSSPTFTILSEHPLPNGPATALYHFDVYRLGSATDFTAIGLDEYFDAGGYCLIEWAERIALCLPKRTVYVDIRQQGDAPSMTTAEDGGLILTADIRPRLFTIDAPADRIEDLREALKKFNHGSPDHRQPTSKPQT